MTWPHALAVAIYVPQLEGKVQSVGKGSAKGYLGMNFEGVPMEQAVEHVGQFHQRMQREGAWAGERAAGGRVGGWAGSIMSGRRMGGSSMGACIFSGR